MCKQKIPSPLSIEEINLIEVTGLPLIDRHHLRLLAHCLACFKLMAKGSPSGSFPNEEDRLKWLTSQSVFNNEKDFILVFLEQLSGAGKQLEVLAKEYNISPLELTLERLIDSKLGQSNT